jgi:ribosomal protein S18 acetylase RimI-like enzyme
MKVTKHSYDSPRAYQDSLNDLMELTFGFRFDQWTALKQWTADYTCYSILENGKMLSNVSTYLMRMRINGVEQVTLQLCSVATREDQRGRGLCRKIMETMLEEHPHTPMFLYANDSVVDFYPRFGFQAVQDRQPWVKAKLHSRPGAMRNLDPASPVVGAYLSQRTCYSNVLDCTNAAPLNWFNLLMGSPTAVYEIPALEVMIAAEQEGDCLTIYDVWAKQPLTFAALTEYLDFPAVERVEFGFNPDWLDVRYQTIPRQDLEDTTIFVRGRFDVEAEYIIPMMSRA